MNILVMVLFFIGVLSGQAFATSCGGLSGHWQCNSPMTGLPLDSTTSIEIRTEHDVSKVSIWSVDSHGRKSGGGDYSLSWDWQDGGYHVGFFFRGRCLADGIYYEETHREGEAWSPMDGGEWIRHTTYTLDSHDHMSYERGDNYPYTSPLRSYIYQCKRIGK